MDHVVLWSQFSGDGLNEEIVVILQVETDLAVI